MRIVNENCKECGAAISASQESIAAVMAEHEKEFHTPIEVPYLNRIAELEKQVETLKSQLADSAKA
jgi:hypothetical protein